MHGFRDHVVLFGPGVFPDQMKVAHTVFDFTGMGCTDGGRGRRGGFIAPSGSAGQAWAEVFVHQGRAKFAIKIPVYRLAAVFAVEVKPFPCAVGNEAVGSKSGGGIFHLFFCLVRIMIQNFLRIIRESRFDLGDKILRGVRGALHESHARYLSGIPSQ